MASSAQPAVSAASSRLTTLTSTLRGIAIVAPWLAYLLVADIILSLLLPLKAFFPTLMYDIASKIAGTVWSWIQRIFVRSNAAFVAIDGDKIPGGESAIVIANHVAWTDFYLIQEVAQRCGMLSRCRWFAKKSLRWVPFLGWGLWAIGMPLVSRRWTSDKSELEKVFSGIVKQKWPVWLISYCEGTRFTAAKHRLAVEWCETNNRPSPKHTLWPRTRGFVATVNGLRKAPHVRAVYDFTIAYARNEEFMQAPTFWETIAAGDLQKAGYRFHVSVDRFELKDLPHTDEELAKWLEDRWVQKDSTLARLERALKAGNFGR